MRSRTLAVGLAVLWGGAVLSAQAPSPPSIPIPGGEEGVGLDDLRYAPELGRILLPAGGTGALLLVDPANWAVTRIGGLSAESRFDGGHDDGVTSADAGGGYVFATDRSARRLAVVDPAGGRVLFWAKLGASPDYVRYVTRPREVWVTEPDAEKIEVFRLEDNPPRPVRDGAIAVPGGPEALVVDANGGVAFTNLWKGETAVIALKNHSIRTKWSNGCQGSRGLAFDESRGFLFVGCSEGKGVTLDAKTGRILGSVRTGEGVDVIDYGTARGHLYLPAGKSATLAIVDVDADGALRLLDSVPTSAGARCATSDGSGSVYVCDPKRGRILVIPDR